MSKPTRTPWRDLRENATLLIFIWLAIYLGYRQGYQQAGWDANRIEIEASRDAQE